MVSNQVRNDEPGDYKVTVSLSMYVCRIVHVTMNGRHRLQLLQLVSSRLLSSSSLMISLYAMSHYNGLCCLSDIFVYHESLQWLMLCLNDIFIYHKPLQWLMLP